MQLNTVIRALVAGSLLALGGCATWHYPYYVCAVESARHNEPVLRERNADPAATAETILPIRPEIYFEQNVAYCGAYSIKAILSAYGRDDSPVEAYMPPLGRLLGGMFPDFLCDKLREYGFDSDVVRLDSLPHDQKLAFIRGELDAGRPVVLLVSNGYRKESGEFSHDQAEELWRLHWITVWGYTESGFYLYDSVVPEDRYDEVPTGNVFRPCDDVLRDMSRPSYLCEMIGYTTVTAAAR